MATTESSAPKEKRAYHHGDLRQALIEAGAELARERGPQGVVVREAARRVGVSHNAAYRHFADRDSLVDAIAEQAMALLTASMQRRIAAADRRSTRRKASALERAQQRVRATGLGYVDFAVTEPGMFRMLTVSFPEGPLSTDPRAPEASTPLDVLSGALDDLAEAGGLAPHRRPAAETLCWSTVHGFSALHVDGPLREVPAKARTEDFERVLDAIQDALGR